MTRLPGIVFALLVFSLPAPAATAQQGQGVTPLDVVKLKRVLSVHPSPDGKQVAFLRTVPRLADDEEPGPSYINLYVVPNAARPDGGDEPRKLIAGKTTVSGVAWRPDGRWITFLDKRGDDEHKEIYALPMTGGEAFRVTKTNTGVLRYHWRPDGKAIAYVSTDKPPKAREEARKLGFKPKVVDEGYDHTCLHLWDVEKSKSKRLTSGPSVQDFAWSPAGDRIVAAICPRPLIDDVIMYKRLHLVDPAGGKVERLFDNPGKLEHFVFSPDGKQVAFAGAGDRNDPHAGMLYVVDVASREVTPLTEGMKGMVHHLHWGEKDRIHACTSRGVYTQVEVMDVRQGKWVEKHARGPAFRSMEFLPGGKSYAAAGSTAQHPEEVFVYGEGSAWKRLTNSNPDLAKVKLGRQTVETITAGDGLKIEGVLHWPLNYQKGKRYPLVILAHGGPESHFSNGWNTSYGRWGQLLSARGYFGWYPNYRASTGYGVDFAKADHGDQMGGQFQDLIDSITEFDKRGLIDPKRVGIGGGSYGGYMAAWAATRESKHFAASVSFVPVVDLVSKWYTSDIPWEFYLVHYREKWPHEQLDFLRERSPVTYAPNCKTPLLLLGGTADTRVHPSQPHMLYKAVQMATKTPVRYVQYPGEGHGNRQNVYRYDYCVRTLRWLDHYLKPGNQRNAEPPPVDVDYGDWKSDKGSDEKPKT